MRDEDAKARFALGQLLMTPGAIEAFARTGEDPMGYLRRHVMGDWGVVDAEDARENEFSVAHGFRILSAYVLRDGTKVWIVTEADRSVTTILLPDEY